MKNKFRKGIYVIFNYFRWYIIFVTFFYLDHASLLPKIKQELQIFTSHEILIFFYTWMISVLFNTIKNRFSIASQSFKISSSSSLLLTALLLLFRIMDFCEKFSPRREDRHFSNIFYFQSLYSLVLQKRRFLVLQSRLSQKFLWRLKRL